MIDTLNKVTEESTSLPRNCSKSTVIQLESYCTNFLLNWTTFIAGSQSVTHTLKVRCRLETKPVYFASKGPWSSRLGKGTR